MIATQSNGDRVIYHSGRGSGITTLCSFYPERRTGFIIITNDGRSEGRLFEMEEQLMKELSSERNHSTNR